MSMLFNTLKRVEFKLDHLSTRPQLESSSESDPDRLDSNHVPLDSPFHHDSTQSGRSVLSPQTHLPRRLVTRTDDSLVLSFSAHQTVHWRGVKESLSQELLEVVSRLDNSYPTRLESERPPLNATILPDINNHFGDWLATLSISCVKELSNAYFDTFNRVYPFIDRDYYFLNTLSVVVREGFGYDIETCLVLNVMTLGCMAVKAYQEGEFDTSQYAALPSLVIQIIDEDISGLSFFNEARKRVGFCLCDRDIQSCQYYLTSAVFFAQTMRPVDEWMMTTRAATSCTAFWKCPPEPYDDWTADIYSRIFWSAILLETIIVQELELPPSSFKEWEDIVPLPKFTAFSYMNKPRSSNSDDSYYHYHFLAQIAHRIILSRIREELFYVNPSTALADELRHQLEQWSANLPDSLKYTDESPDQGFRSPADAVVVALLYTRYRVSIFHLGRPFLYRAIQSPLSLTEKDLSLCREALQHAMDWPLTWEICAKMKNFMPLKYFASGQMFGQLLIFHAFKRSPDPRLQKALPTGFELWCTKMLRFISELTESSPTIGTDFEMLSVLYQLNGKD
jgi:hypothetical protein